MSVELYCLDPLKKGCHWFGGPSELVCLTDDLDDQEFKYCPQCGGEDFEEEEVEE